MNGLSSFERIPDLMEYYIIIGNGILLKQECTTMANHTLLKDIGKFMSLTQLNFMEDTPNQILHMLSTLIS